MRRAALLLATIISLCVGPSAFSAAPSANELLLTANPSHPTLRSTATRVSANRFAAVAAAFQTAVTDVRFAVGDVRTDVLTSDTIPAPLRLKRHGVYWDEYNMLVSGIGFSNATTYTYGKAQGEGRWLNVRLLVPKKDWNGRLVFWHHGTADTQLLAYTPVIEPETLLDRGYAVAMAVFSGATPAQQNPNASDDSYWAGVDEMYKADPGGYSSYTSHPDWQSNSGSALGDGATLRNLTNLVKNLLFRTQGRQPEHSYWLGWSAAGTAGTAVNIGRDIAGNYTGGNFNVPYVLSSGKIFDGFAALEPVNIAQTPVDPQFPISAPYEIFDGDVTPLSLSFPNALDIAHKVKTALDGPLADPSLSRDINDWVRLYMQRYGNHDWSGRFFHVLRGGAEGSRNRTWYDVSVPLAARFNSEHRGRELNWVMSKLERTSPKYLHDWADENLSGWGQLHSAYYQINDGYHLALFEHLVEWAERGTPPPTSRVDPYLRESTTTTYPNLPQNDPTQDSLNRRPSVIDPPTQADLTWLRTSPDALDVVWESVAMPHVTARRGIFRLGYKVMLLTPFTPDQLVNGYESGNISFSGYADEKAYEAAFTDAAEALTRAGLFDAEVAYELKDGDTGAPPLEFPDGH